MPGLPAPTSRWQLSTASYRQCTERELHRQGQARAASEALNDRDALAASRQALEMLSEKAWRWLGSHGQGVLNLMLAERWKL